MCVSGVLRVCSGCARMRMCVPRQGAFQRSLGCRPASHCTASFRHPSYLRVLSSGFSRTGPRQEKLPPAGRSKPPAWAWRRAISDTARLRNVQAARKNSLHMVSEHRYMHAHGMRLSHARGSRMNERGDGTAASSAFQSAMPFRICSALPGTNSPARHWLNSSTRKQSSWARHTDTVTFLLSTRTNLTMWSPMLMVCTGSILWGSLRKPKAMRGWGLTFFLQQGAQHSFVSTVANANSTVLGSAKIGSPRRPIFPA